MSRVKVSVCAAVLASCFVVEAAGGQVNSRAETTPQTTPNPFIVAQSSSMPNPATQKAAAARVPLTLQRAIEMALQNNLGPLLSQQGTRAARAQRLRALSQILPNLTSRVTENIAEDNLAARGIRFPGVPEIVGPFSFFDARLFLSQSILDLTNINRARAAGEDLSAAEFNYQDARNLVVTAAATSYLRALSAAARVDAVQVQVDTARALYIKAVDLHKAGLTPAIDSVRAQVELQAREQQLIAAKNIYSKNLLDIARVIGLPLGQTVELAEKIPYAPLESLTLESAIDRAATTRADLKSASARVRSAELNRKAASSERLPSLSADANYGGIGLTPGSARGTVNASGTLKLTLFDSGRIHSDVLQADAALRQQRSQFNDLRAQVEYEVRTAFLDLNSAADQVRVSTSSVDLARQTLDQARDRFASGVADNLEVVQAQEAFANANDNYIDSLFAFNLSKLSLARALGVAEGEARPFLEGK